jgi:NADH-quinone oxidoreductase subunit N
VIAVSVAPISTPHIEWLAIAPELALVGAALAVILARSIIRGRGPAYEVALGLTGCGLAGAAATIVWQWYHVRHHGPITTLAGMVRVDSFGVFLGGLVVIAAALAALLALTYVRREGLEGPEYLALLLLSAVGMLVMTAAGDLIVVFLALEVLSIPLYVLTAFDRRRLASQEAGIKYFVLGAVSSAVLLYGVALVYGGTGTTSLAGIARYLDHHTLTHDGTLVAGFGLLMVGLGFKVSAAPFHMWTPDVYQGAPSPITAFMSSATKVAGFAAFLRVFVTAFPSYRDDWRPVIMALAVLSLAVGTIAALVQTDLKRLLAYSSIGHAGYVLIGFAAAAVGDRAAAHRGLEAALLYLATYTFMTVGAFAVVTIAGRGTNDARHGFAQYRGLARRQPALGAFLTFFLLAQAGVPFTGGFVAKLHVFAAAVDAREYWLAVVGVLAAAVAAYFYLRVTVVVLSSDEGSGAEPVTDPSSGRPFDAASALVLAITGFFVVLIGVLPGTFVHLARDASSLL